MSDKPVVVCPKCGARLVNIVSGALCPMGCGGLFPKVPDEEQAKAIKAARVSSLPKAIELTQIKAAGSVEPWVSTVLYRVDGQAGIWRRVARETTSITKPLDVEGDVLAHQEVDEAVIRIRRFASAEEELILAAKLIHEREPEDMSDPDEAMR